MKMRQSPWIRALGMTVLSIAVLFTYKIISEGSIYSIVYGYEIDGIAEITEECKVTIDIIAMLPSDLPTYTLNPNQVIEFRSMVLETRFDHVPSDVDITCTPNYKITISYPDNRADLVLHCDPVLQTLSVKDQISYLHFADNVWKLSKYLTYE